MMPRGGGGFRAPFACGGFSWSCTDIHPNERIAHSFTKRKFSTLFEVVIRTR